MHHIADEDRYKYAKSRTTGDDALPLPGNKRNFPEGHLVFGIEESVAFCNPASETAVLRFVLLCQLASSSPVLDVRFNESCSILPA
jgi:hypothetical protein